MNVDHVINDQGAAFVTTQDPGGECPCDLQVFDVLGVDLAQFAVAGRRVITARDRPVCGILYQFL